LEGLQQQVSKEGEQVFGRSWLVPLGHGELEVPGYPLKRNTQDMENDGSPKLEQRGLT
jgi:hypothetical protein